MLVTAAGDHIDKFRRDAGFFYQFAQRGFFGIFTVINPALGHLPSITFRSFVDALAYKNLTFGIGKHDSRTRAVR